MEATIARPSRVSTGRVTISDEATWYHQDHPEPGKGHNSVDDPPTQDKLMKSVPVQVIPQMLKSTVLPSHGTGNW